MAATVLFSGNANAAKGDKVFYSSADLAGSSNIFLYDSATGLNTKLLTNMPAHALLGSFKADPKGLNVYFTSDILSANTFELSRIDIKSSSTYRISLPIDTGEDVGDDFKLDAKGASVFYRVQESDGSSNLYRYSVKAKDTIRINPEMASGRYISAFEVHPKGTSALYLTDLGTQDQTELYMSAAKEGSPAVKLSETLPENGDVDDFVVNAKGTAAAYRADKDTDGMYELFYVDLKTKAVKKLNLTLPAGGNVIDYAFDPKGKSVVYIADQDVVDKHELYKVDIKTGNVVKLNSELAEDRDVIEFKIDSKGANVYYLADQVTNTVDELFQVNLKTLGNAKLNIPLVENGDVQQFGLDGKGAAVFYVADQEVNDKTELYRYDLKSGQIRKLSDPGVSNQYIVGGDVNATGTGIAYYSVRSFLNSDLNYYNLATDTRIQIDGMFDFVLIYKLLGGLQFMGNPFVL